MRGMTVNQRLIPLAVSICAALFLGACSSQQDEEALEVTEDEEQGNLGADDAAEGNGQENFVDEEGQQGSNQQQANEGAEVNSETGNESEELNPTLDNSAGADPALNPAAANPAAMDPAAANPAAMDPAAMDPAANAAAAPAPTEQSPVPGGRVRYVKEGGVQVVNQPGGSPVVTLDQGEHPVTWEENGWLKLTTGMYVPTDAMSDLGVARPAGGAGWTQ